MLAVFTCAPGARAQSADPGAEVYRQSGCVVCHGGLGTGGFGPKLAGDPMLAISPFVTARILIGSGGSSGAGSSSSKMPAFGDKLSDEQIAAVAHYIRNNWGNDFGPVTADQAADARRLMTRAMQIAAKAAKAQQ